MYKGDYEKLVSTRTDIKTLRILRVSTQIEKGHKPMTKIIIKNLWK
jgi:hypothetical protein